MSYQRTEYHREVNRDDDRDQKSGGWKSWFGLGDNKERDEDRGYNYQKTTTYRDEHPSTYGGYSGPQRTGYSGAVSTGYSGPRGGYGYTTSDEVNRGPSWNTDRDYHTRSSYGQPTGGDRDVYYKQETRTYGGDRDYTARSYTPSRTDYPTPSRTYGGEYSTPSRTFDTPSRGYGFSGDKEYNVSRTYTTGGDRDVSYTSRGYGGEPTSRYESTTRGYPSTGYTSGGYGGESTYTRPSYQQSSYRY